MIEIFKMHPELQKFQNNEQTKQFSKSKSNTSLAFRTMMFKAYNLFLTWLLNDKIDNLIF